MLRLVAMVGLVVCCGLVSSTLVAPLLIPAGTSTAAITLSSGTLLAGTLGAAATVGVAALSVAALAAASRNRESSYSRHRRSVVDQTLEEVFAMVARVDSEGCGLRHVCQVFSKTPEALNYRERAIRRLVGDKPVPVSPKKNKNPSAFYQSAAILGDRGENCFTIYNTCSLSYTEVEDFLTELDAKL